MISLFTIYGGLFSAALLAATIIPAQSEALLLGLIATKEYSIVALIVVASLGNVLGSIINWWLGTQIERFKDKKWFPVNPSSLEKSQNWYKKYGRWLLLLSWVPIIGDPITVAAGVLKERLIIFILIVSLAKTCRYIFLAAGYTAIFS